MASVAELIQGSWLLKSEMDNRSARHSDSASSFEYALSRRISCSSSLPPSMYVVCSKCIDTRLEKTARAIAIRTSFATSEFDAGIGGSGCSPYIACAWSSQPLCLWTAKHIRSDQLLISADSPRGICEECRLGSTSLTYLRYLSK